MGRNLKPSTINALIERGLAIEAESAQDADALRFMARAMTLVSLPHRNVPGREFARTNGNITVAVTAGYGEGLPYGPVVRLLYAWLTTEAVRTKNRVLMLEGSLAGFMAELGLASTGGVRGTIRPVKEQTRRLFSATIATIYKDNQILSSVGHRVTDQFTMWWSAKAPAQGSLFQSSVTLSQPFYDELVAHAVPIDMRALRALKQSSMALDIYLWLTHRLFNLKDPIPVSWEGLQAQFGAGYPETAQGLRDFRKGFLHATDKVLVVYKDAKIQPAEKGVLLLPSPPHVRTRKANGR
jgi:hypothetical protein